MRSVGIDLEYRTLYKFEACAVTRKAPVLVRSDTDLFSRLTGHASLEVAIRAINEGQIYRFFTKPWNDVDLAITIRQALQQKDLIEESRRLLKIARHQSAILQELEKNTLDLRV